MRSPLPQDLRVSLKPVKGALSQRAPFAPLPSFLVHPCKRREEKKLVRETGLWMTNRISFRPVTHSLHLLVEGLLVSQEEWACHLPPGSPVNHQARQAPSRQEPGWARGD